MKALFAVLLLLFSGFAKATNYYVNPSSDSTKEKGTKVTPWKSLNAVNNSMRLFRGGDTIYFKKGELFFGYLDIKCSGLPNAPIVFSTYGNAAAIPVFLYQPDDFNLHQTDDAPPPREPITIRFRKCNYIIIDGFEITDDKINIQDHNIQALVKTGFAIEQCNFITIRNSKVSLVGIGINMQGSNNLVDKCEFKNLRMVRNTVGGDDDFGADAIVIAGNSNKISGCLFEDCWANSFDYGYSGEAIKIFGSCNNNNVLNNTAINCNGFITLGSDDAGTSFDNLIGKNTIINCGTLLYFYNNEASFSLQNLFFINNIIIQNVNQFTEPKNMISMTKASQKKGLIQLENNIFWITTAIDLARAQFFSDGQIIHHRNTYYLAGGNLNYDTNKSESLLDKNTAIFKDDLSGYPAHLNPDLFPFIYLLRYWYLLLF